MHLLCLLLIAACVATNKLQVWGAAVTLSHCPILRTHFLLQCKTKVRLLTGCALRELRQTASTELPPELAVGAVLCRLSPFVCRRHCDCFRVVHQGCAPVHQCPSCEGRQGDGKQAWPQRLYSHSRQALAAATKTPSQPLAAGVRRRFDCAGRPQEGSHDEKAQEQRPQQAGQGPWPCEAGSLKLHAHAVGPYWVQQREKEQPEIPVPTFASFAIMPSTGGCPAPPAPAHQQTVPRAYHNTTQRIGPRLAVLQSCSRNCAAAAPLAGEAGPVRGLGRAGAQGQGGQALHRAQHCGRVRHPGHPGVLGLRR